MPPTPTVPNTASPKSGRATDKRLILLDAAMKKRQHRPDALIEVLHVAQDAFGFLEPDILRRVARGLGLPLSRVFGVATFYHLFQLRPPGKHVCVVCLGTACYVKGGEQLMTAMERSLGVARGRTTADGEVSLAEARCFGACGLAPAAIVDGTVHGNLRSDELLDRVAAARGQPQRENPIPI